MAAEGGEAVAAGALHGAAVDDVDVVPAHELPLQRGVDGGVGVLDAAEGLVGEHDAEAVRAVRCVALVDGDRAGGVEPLEERRGVQPAGPAADDRGPHGAQRPCQAGGRLAVNAAWNSA